jgi:hypothetical protein
LFVSGFLEEKNALSFLKVSVERIGLGLVGEFDRTVIIGFLLYGLDNLSGLYVLSLKSLVNLNRSTSHNRDIIGTTIAQRIKPNTKSAKRLLKKTQDEN